MLVQVLDFVACHVWETFSQYPSPRNNQTWHATSLHSSGIRTVVINKNGDLRSEASILNYYHSGWRFFNNSILCICSE